MQRKKLATKIASILLSAAMLASSTMIAFATDGEVSVAVEQTEVQTVAETADDEALEASEEDVAASEEIAEETAAEEEITADEVITKESTTEEAQENVEEAQVLDADEAQVLDADEVVAVADENDIALAASEGWYDVGGDSKIEFRVDNNILEFRLYDDVYYGALPDYTAANQTPWYKQYGADTMGKIQKIKIGSDIAVIGAHNFDNGGNEQQGGKVYTSLTTVELTSSVTDIHDYAFRDVSTLSLVSENNQDYISKNVSLHNIKSIGEQAFKGTGITSVRLNQDNVKIGHSAFCECSALTIVSTKGNVELSSYSFSDCKNLETFSCSGTIESVPDHAFCNCVKLDATQSKINGVKEIGYWAFYNCSKLTGFNFTEVTSMSEAALQGSGIEKVWFKKADLKDVDKEAFSGSKVKSICYIGTRTEWNKLALSFPGAVNVHCVGSDESQCETPSPGVQSQYQQCDLCGDWYKASTPEPEPETEPETEPESEPDTGNPDSEHTHSWSAWKTKTPATVFAAEVQERTCTVCKTTDTRTVGKKLTPTITVNAKKIWLQKGQKTSAFKVSGLANGDSVKSYKSSNKKIFTVTNKGVIKAGKKIGKAKLTVTLASGKKKVVTVQVMNRRVKTRDITNLPSKVTLKKGATYKLSPIVIQITSTHKLTYASSNKKVATVTSAGKIKGVKKGTATITVKSGTVTKKVKVTVK